MSKLKKLAVCLTALIIIFSFSILSVSASSNDNFVAGQLPSGYESIPITNVSGNWYYTNGTYIGPSDVQVESNGKIKFYDTLYNFVGQTIELRIYFSVPADYIGKYFDYHFQINSEYLSRAVPNDSRNSLIKYSYNTTEQTNYILNTYFDFENGYESGYNYGFYASNVGIKLSRNVIGLSLFYTIGAYDSSYPLTDRPVEVLIGGFENSRNNPSSPAYDKPNTDKFNELEDLENQLTEDSQQQSNDEINKVNDSLLGSLQRYTSGFSAVGALFLNLALKVVDIQALVYISLAIGVVPLIVGLTVNGLRASDKKSNYKGRDD